MKLSDLVKAFLPVLKKNEILDDLRVTIGELENTVIPCYEQAATFLNTQGLKSDANKALGTLFYRSFDLKGRRKGKTFINDINAYLGHLLENIKYLRTQAEETLSRDVVAEGLTARRLTLLRMSANVSFLTRYCSDLLNLVYFNEVKHSDAEMKVEMDMAPIVIRSIESNIGKFAYLFDRLAINNKDFVKLFSAIPEVIVSEDNEELLRANYSRSELMPFGEGGMVKNFIGNPIYHIRLNIAEWQAKRYHKAKDQKKILELRLLQLEHSKDGEYDHKLEREINYIQGRIDKLDRYIRESEEKVGGF